MVREGRLLSAQVSKRLHEVNKVYLSRSKQWGHHIDLNYLNIESNCLCLFLQYHNFKILREGNLISKHSFIP